MGVPDPILNKLISHLRWPVKRTPEAYLVEFDFDDRKKIGGLVFTPIGPKIADTVDFDTVPILFKMTQSSSHDSNVRTEVHYHTLAGLPHRVGKPARYEINGIDGLTVRMLYYEHGIHHRDDGPAQIILSGVEQVSFMDNGIEVSGPYCLNMNKMHLAWYRKGISGPKSGPSMAVLKNVSLLYDQDGLYSDYGDRKALTAESASWWWSTQYSDENELLPYKIIIRDMVESYEHGEWRSRIGKFEESYWFRGPTMLGRIEDFPPPFMINEIDLWKGSFADAAASIKLEDAFRKLPT